MAGHYQLMTDVQLKGQASMQEDAKICLDLNGHRLDGKEGTRLYSIHNPGGALAIMDTSEGQTGVVAAHGKTNAGGSCLWPRYGALYLYSGTVDASDVITTGNGAAVYVPKNSYFYMYGGTIKGGTSDYTHNPENDTYGAGLGGNVYVVGKFVLHDGLITGGDLIRRLKTVPMERLLIPANMLRQEGDCFLDDVTVEQVAKELGTVVEIIPETDGATLFAALVNADETKGEDSHG
jgi:hypothetical protein